MFLLINCYIHVLPLLSLVLACVSITFVLVYVCASCKALHSTVSTVDKEHEKKLQDPSFHPPSKFYINPFRSFCVILLRNQKHNLLAGGNNNDS